MYITFVVFLLSHLTHHISYFVFFDKKYINLFNIMPSLNINWLKDNLKNDNIEKDYPVFIETGTLYGNTIIPLEKYFTELHTIEIKKELFDHVKKTYNKSKINFHLGDSGEMLAKICPDIKLNTIFF